jgi:hypothetical protein
MRTTAQTGFDQATSPLIIIIAESARFPKPLFNPATRSEAAGKSSGQNRNPRSALHQAVPSGRIDGVTVRLDFIGGFARADVGDKVDTGRGDRRRIGNRHGHFRSESVRERANPPETQRQAGSWQRRLLKYGLGCERG